MGGGWGCVGGGGGGRARGGAALICALCMHVHAPRDRHVATPKPPRSSCPEASCNGAFAADVARTRCRSRPQMTPPSWRMSVDEHGPRQWRLVGEVLGRSEDCCRILGIQVKTGNHGESSA